MVTITGNDVARAPMRRSTGHLKIGGVPLSIGSLVVQVVTIISLVALTLHGDVDGTVTVPIIATLAGVGATRISDVKREATP